jgi:Fe-S-cluster containining protein
MPDGGPAPWYSRGLRFVCESCGHCCTGSPGYVWVTRSDLEAIARLLGQTFEEALPHVRSVEGRTSLRELAFGDCLFYHPVRGCRIYPVRPAQCATWPFWATNLSSPEAWQTTTRNCLGVGRGKWDRPERIARRARVVLV